MSASPHPIRLIHGDEVPPGSRWLGARERSVEAGFVRPRRRREWRAGRWAAKRLLAEPLGLFVGELERVQILGAADGAPAAYLDDRELAVPISISHRGVWAVAAVRPEGGAIGIDLELVEPRTERFVRDYFTHREVDRYDRLPRELRDLYAVAVWSAKEGVLKCVRTGLRRDTRTVEVELEPEGASANWRGFDAADLTGHRVFDGWWMRRDELLCTVVAPR